ncbi:MAG TPA: tripartite tricarboxylate transporter substrate-binding protein [Beijerinckiaceae bacterium]|nr:tripartite tricarboxylate transporter substrate-binding protein [Beijerinckiaceae bacterium]
MRFWVKTAGSMVVLACGLAAARADDASDFYKGKNIDLILSAGAGGGYAQYAFAFAPYFTAHIPGNPKIVIQNMTGGGGIRAMNFLQSVAPKDGTTLGLVHSSVPFAPLYGIQGAQFDPRQMQWIGSINKTSAMCVSWAASGVKDWQDLLDGKYIVGGTGAGSQMETMPAMLNKLFGTKIKVISGYVGGSDVYLAMERGEVNGRCGGLYSSIVSTRPDWFPQHKINVPIVVGMERNPRFPDTPAVAEFAKDDRTRQILQLTLAPLEMDRPILAPPGVPADRVAALRKAFHEAMIDPAFIAEAKKEKLEIDEVSGERLKQVLDEAFALPADVVEAANEAMNLTGSTSSKSGGSKSSNSK